MVFERTGTRGVRQRCHQTRRRQMHLDLQKGQGPGSRGKNHLQGDDLSFMNRYVHSHPVNHRDGKDKLTDSKGKSSFLYPGRFLCSILI